MKEKKFDYFITGEKAKWEVIIGLEVHAQVLSKSKLFSFALTLRVLNLSVKKASEPNTLIFSFHLVAWAFLCSGCVA